RFNDGAIQLEAEFHHGVGLVDVIGREQPAYHGAKHVLHCGNYRTVLLDTSGDVKESEKYTRGADAHELITVTADAMIVIARRKLSVLKLRNFGVNRAAGLALSLRKVEESMHTCFRKFAACCDILRQSSAVCNSLYIPHRRICCWVVRRQ